MTILCQEIVNLVIADTKLTILEGGVDFLKLINKYIQ
jgi:hypothetical protein